MLYWAENSPTSQTCEMMSVSWILSFGLILKQDLRLGWLDFMARPVQDFSDLT